MSTQPAVAATRLLADFVSALTWTDVPDNVRAASRAAVVDVAGSVVGGSRDLAVERTASALTACGLAGDIAVLGRGARLSPFAAAVVSGVAATVGASEAARPGVAVVSAALSTAQVTGASGADVVVAVAAGLEVASRIGEALGDQHAVRGWDVAGTLGVVGAAVAAGRLSGLSPDRMEHAIALAATQAAGHRAQAGTMAVSLHAGKAAGDGIEAVQLASHGMVGPAAALEGRRGMGALMADGIDVERLLDGLGVTWSDAFLAGQAAAPSADDLRRRFDGRVEPVLAAGTTALWAAVSAIDGLDGVESVVALSRPAECSA